MTKKQKVLKAIRVLPADASYEDAVERIIFLSKIEKGLSQADAGQTISHDAARQKMRKFLK